MRPTRTLASLSVLALAWSTDLDQLDPVYDSGDHLHPNDAGYRAMADAVDVADLG